MNLTIVRRDGSEHTVLFDAADEALVKAHTWHVFAGGHGTDLFYAATHVRNSSGVFRRVFMHALLMGQPGIDHRNSNGLDNRRANLRPATVSQNMGNRRPTPGGASVYKGVNLCRGRWRARIGVDQRRLSLGHFDSEIEAAKAYDRAALEAWGSYACLNFPDIRSTAA